MARSQEELQEILSSFDGVVAAYIQKPLNVKLTPPYVVHELDGDWVARADNTVYASMNKYTVTLVAREPDTPIFDVIRVLPYTKFDRRLIVGGLYNFIFTTYF